MVSETDCFRMVPDRADNIVRDAEAVRMAMVPSDAPGGGRWTLLGQSFGGFCAVRSPPEL